MPPDRFAAQALPAPWAPIGPDFAGEKSCADERKKRLDNRSSNVYNINVHAVVAE